MNQKRQADLEEEERLKRRDRALQSTYYFGKFVCGFKDFDADLHGFMGQWVQKPTRFKLGMAPRSMFKSSIWTISDGLRRSTIDPHRKTLIVNEVRDNTIKWILYMQSVVLSPTYRWLFPEVVPDPKDVRWNQTQLELKRTVHMTEPTVEGCGVGGASTSSHYNCVINDDLVGKEARESPSVMTKAIEQYRLSNSLLVNPSEDSIHTFGCLKAGSLVAMSDGTWKRIENVEPGEYVWTIDKNGESTSQMVEAMIPQGDAPTMSITTRCGTITCTPNHPFLAAKPKVRSGTGYPRWDLEWRKAEDLKIDDVVIGSRALNCTTNGPSERAWLAGFLYGDGWARYRPEHGGRWYVCIAKSKYEDLNQRILATVKSEFDVEMRDTEFGYWRSDVSAFARWAISLSLDRTAREKRVPQEIFRWTYEDRKAFLRGLGDADGYVLRESTNTIVVELANKQLVEDVRLLALTSGVRPGTIYYRKRLAHPPHSPEPFIAESWTIHLTFLDELNAGLWRDGGRLDFESFRPQRVTKIEKTGIEEPVFDLTVSGTSCFIADGFVVHNTRWGPKDLIDWMLKTIGKDLDVLHLKAHKPNGQPIFPARLPEKEIIRIKRELGIEFYMLQYENEALGAGVSEFDPDWVNYWTETKMEKDGAVVDALLLEGPRGRRVVALDDCTVFQVTDAGLSPESKDARTANVTVALAPGHYPEDPFDVILLDDFAKKCDPPQVIHHSHEIYQRCDPATWAIESVGGHQIFFHWIQQDFPSARIKKLKTDSHTSKFTRIRSFNTIFANRRFYCHRNHGNFLDEYAMFPNGKTVDVLDALAYTPQIWFPPEDSRVPAGEEWFDRRGNERPEDDDADDEWRGDSEPTGNAAGYE